MVQDEDSGKPRTQRRKGFDEIRNGVTRTATVQLPFSLHVPPPHANSLLSVPIGDTTAFVPKAQYDDVSRSRCAVALHFDMPRLRTRRCVWRPGPTLRAWTCAVRTGGDGSLHRRGREPGPPREDHPCHASRERRDRRCASRTARADGRTAERADGSSSSRSMTIPAPLCEHHGAARHVRGTRAVCDTCGSFWDLESLEASVRYDETYPAQRGHFDPRVGALKARTLRRWLRSAAIDLRGASACATSDSAAARVWRCLAARRSRRSGSRPTSRRSIGSRQAASTPICCTSSNCPSPTPDRFVAVSRQLRAHSRSVAIHGMAVRNSSPVREILLGRSARRLAVAALLGGCGRTNCPIISSTGRIRVSSNFMARRGFHVHRRFFPLKFVVTGDGGRAHPAQAGRLRRVRSAGVARSPCRSTLARWASAFVDALSECSAPTTNRL